MNCNTPTPPTPGAPGAESDAEVNAALAKLRGWIDVYDGRGRQPFGGSMYRAGRRKIHDYCSPDAPHALRVELVEAVIKAGVFPEFFKIWNKLPLDAERERVRDINLCTWAKDQEISWGLFLGLTEPPRILARAALVALRAGEVKP